MPPAFVLSQDQTLRENCFSEDLNLLFLFFSILTIVSTVSSELIGYIALFSFQTAAGVNPFPSSPVDLISSPRLRRQILNIVAFATFANQLSIFFRILFAQGRFNQRHHQRRQFFNISAVADFANHFCKFSAIFFILN